MSMRTGSRVKPAAHRLQDACHRDDCAQEPFCVKATYQATVTATHRRDGMAKSEAEQAAQQQRAIQRGLDGIDARKAGGTDAEGAVQAGARPQPAPPFPALHLQKPGLESELDPPPQFMAPGYRGSGKLQDMAAIVTGGDSGIGRAVAVLYAREGADVAIVYLNEHGDAQETKRCVEAEGRRCLLIAGDVRDAAFCNDAVKQTVDAFGKLDILVNNAAFQEHATALED